MALSLPVDSGKMNKLPETYAGKVFAIKDLRRIILMFKRDMDIWLRIEGQMGTFEVTAEITCTKFFRSYVPYIPNLLRGRDWIHTITGKKLERSLLAQIFMHLATMKYKIVNNGEIWSFSSWDYTGYYCYQIELKYSESNKITIDIC